ncbi:hypothetical protein TNCT_168841 [Trichonephila clavata]|uniref:Uncharacterized protein n=1 Tax=Trichonephila clavata TaxID=2740835 RepID=A0A8X6M160_TRICU|nr:hypothetical protein TNCT_168841 [Trichonephila clavata]
MGTANCIARFFPPSHSRSLTEKELQHTCVPMIYPVHLLFHRNRGSKLPLQLGFKSPFITIVTKVVVVINTDSWHSNMNAENKNKNLSDLFK